MSKLRIQQYMDKHKLTPLFEELMNKVLHDQPDDPLVYLIRNLYKKAALPVPKDLKPGTLRRSSPERLAKRSKSPEKSGSTQAWAVASGPGLVDRSYEKPWLSKTKSSKQKDEDRPASPTKYVRKRQGRSKSPGQKHKQAWVADTKVTTTTFDDLFEEDTIHKTETAVKQRKGEGTDIKKAWAKNIGLEDGEDVNFRSRGYRGPRHTQGNDDDPLAGEIMLAKEENSEKSEKKKKDKDKSKSKKNKKDKKDKKHKKELEKELTKSESRRTASPDSGFDGNRSDVEDDAIELLEDPEDLKREGVTNISKSGYKLGRILKHRQEEANVKLNINLFTSNLASRRSTDNPYADYYESDLERPPTGMSYQSNRYSQFSPDMSEDEEFESVSQVVGPRKPVWSAPDSDTETRRPDMSQTLPERGRRHKQAGFSATMPTSFDDPGRPPFQRSLEADAFLQASKSRPQPSKRNEEDLSPSPPDVRDSTRSLRSLDGGGGGWNIPDDDGFTEVSRATSAITPSGPPKAY